MSISAQDLADHLTSTIESGFEINSPEFAKLAGWNDIVVQTMMAKHFLSRLRNHQRVAGGITNLFDEAGLFLAFLVTYGKCFNSAGGGKMTLDAKDVFKDIEPQVVEAHERIMNLRNTYAAHNSESELVANTMAVRDTSSEYVIRHITTRALPGNELDEFAKAVTTLEEYGVLRLNRILARLEARLGKPIILD